MLCIPCDMCIPGSMLCIPCDMGIPGDLNAVSFLKISTPFISLHLLAGGEHMYVQAITPPALMGSKVQAETPCPKPSVPAPSVIYAKNLGNSGWRVIYTSSPPTVQACPGGGAVHVNTF